MDTQRQHIVSMPNMIWPNYVEFNSISMSNYVVCNFMSNYTEQCFVFIFIPNCVNLSRIMVKCRQIYRKLAFMGTLPGNASENSAVPRPRVPSSRHQIELDFRLGTPNEWRCSERSISKSRGDTCVACK